MQPPVMPEDSHTTRVTSGEDASCTVTGKDSSVLEAIWDDEDTRSFYECLPDLRFVSTLQKVCSIGMLFSLSGPIFLQCH